MGEKFPNKEQGVEQLPTYEQIKKIFKRFAEGKTPKETRSRYDGSGLYLFDAEIDGKKPGEVTEFSYIRKGSYTEGSSTKTTIQATYYEDGMPVGGKTLANFIDNKWVY